MRERALKGTGILQALLTMDVVSAAALGAVVWALDHPPVAGGDPLPRHVAWGVAATLLSLVARCVAIFYMLASGRAVKDLVAQHGLDPAYVVRAKRLKRPVETLATLALVPVMAAAMTGGGAPGNSHAAWAWTAVAFAVACLAVDLRAGLANYALLREVDERVAES